MPDMVSALRENTKFYLMDFSSEGPTLDNRIKPDVCMMGADIYSALSAPEITAPHCGFIQKSSTAVSAAMAAGILGNLREYFLNGYHVDGVKDPSNKLDPSSALLKACLIASTVNAYGFVEEGYSVYHIYKKFPQNKHGFGIASLSRVIGFNDYVTQHLKVVESSISRNSEYAVLPLLYMNISFYIQKEKT